MQRSRPLLRIRIIFLLITAAFIIFTVGTVVLFLMNVRIQTVTVENCVYSDEQSIISAAGIKKGTHSYAIDKEEIAKSIKEKNSYVSDVRVKRTGPTSVVLILTEDPPCFRTLYENRYLVLSAGLRVLDEYSSPEEAPHVGIAPIKLMPIESAELGKEITFTEENEGDRSEYVSMLSAIHTSLLEGNVTSADISCRFDIRITYKDKYEIRFGSPKNFEKKLALVIDTVLFLEDPENNYSGAKGIIRANVDGETSFEPTGAISGQ